MSEWPTVVSMGCFRIVYFTGLNGSMRPRPQSGRSHIQASALPRRRSARRVPGMIANRYSSRSSIESRVFFAISARIVSGVKRGSVADRIRNRRYCCGAVWCDGAPATMIGASPGLTR